MQALLLNSVNIINIIDTSYYDIVMRVVFCRFQRNIKVMRNNWSTSSIHKTVIRRTTD